MNNLVVINSTFTYNLAHSNVTFVHANIIWQNKFYKIEIVINLTICMYNICIVNMK